MAHLTFEPGLPGLLGPMAKFPHSASPLKELAQALLQRNTPSFSKAEREFLAAFVANECGSIFCAEAHAATANALQGKEGWAQSAWSNIAALPAKLRDLAVLGGKVRISARTLSALHIESLRTHGFSDDDINDAVLIASMLVMFCNYADGLSTHQPSRGDRAYKALGERIAAEGYVTEQTEAEKLKNRFQAEPTGPSL